MTRTPPAIPTTLITGFLGVGKTTAVLDLLRRKSPAERWAVLVNEYGSVSIDDAFIEGETPPEGVSVRSVAGGCFCCTTAPMLPVALHFLLQSVTPDRLLIETSGLGHPARLLDTVRTNYAGRLDLRATLGIVTPSDFTAPGMIDSNPVFRDQVQMSDVLVLNKADTATPEVVEQFQAWANGLFPPKLLVVATTDGRLDPAWLDLDSNAERMSLYPELHAEHQHEETVSLGSARPGKPVRYASPDGVRPACGWVFHPADVFDEDKLLAVLANPAFARLKGVFHCENEWIAVNRTADGTTVKPTASRRDSRVEIFAETVPDGWSAVEAALVGCLLGVPA